MTDSETARKASERVLAPAETIVAEKGTCRAIEFRILIKFGRHTPMDSKNL